jgi:negative regulator of flagellin synthesis FlgM
MGNNESYQEVSSVKIDNISSNRIPLDMTQKKTAVKSDNNAQSKTNPSGEAFSVKISAALEQMKSSSGTLENDDIRREKVAAIRSQLASGTYNISGKDVASKILDAIK